MNQDNTPMTSINAINQLSITNTSSLRNPSPTEGSVLMKQLPPKTPQNNQDRIAKLQGRLKNIQNTHGNTNIAQNSKIYHLFE